jgi:hypothetical protein
MILGLAVAGWSIQSLVFPTQAPVLTRRASFLLIAIVAACSLSPFVNPFGMEMIATWQRIVGSKVLPKVVNEHMPLDPTSPLGLTVIAFGIGYGALLLGSLPRLPRVSWLIPLVWLVLSFKSIRQGPLFVITAVVAIADLWPHTIWYRWLKAHGDGSLARDPDAEPHQGLGLIPMLAPAMIILFALGLQANRIAVPVVGHGWARLDPQVIPSDLIDEIRAYAASVPPGTRIFNDANLGGFLIYHTPSLKIFMDDRCELYGDDQIEYYSETLGLPPEELGPRFEDWSNRFQFDRAFVMTDPTGIEPQPLEQFLLHSPLWHEVARGKRAVIFERTR